MNATIRKLVLPATLLGAAGCTIIDGQRQNQETAERIRGKEATLTREEQQQATLNAERQRLARDLANQRMTLDEVNARLDRLQQENERSAVATQEQRDRKNRLQQQIAARKAELAQLRNSNDLPDAEKTRRIETLKQQISQQLEFQLR